jgi:protein-L-isoaspartate(D-aspartate) O-methyltransferase
MIKLFKMFSTHSKSKMNKLVDHLINTGAITSTRVADVMRKVDRGDFCDNVMAYDDCPQSINYNATISAPHMHAYCMVSFVSIIK